MRITVIYDQLKQFWPGARVISQFFFISLSLSLFLTCASSRILLNLPVSIILVLIAYLYYNIEIRRRAFDRSLSRQLQADSNEQNNRNFSLNKQTGFKRDAWKQRVNSKVVEYAWTKFCNSIVQHWVCDTWFGLLSPDQEFPAEVRRLLNSAFGELAVRARAIDVKGKLLRDMCKVLAHNLELYRCVAAQVGRQKFASMSLQDRDMVLIEELDCLGALHPSFRSHDGHYQQLKALGEQWVAELFPDEEVAHTRFRPLLRELVVSCGLRPALTQLLPHNFNKTLLKVLPALPKTEEEAPVSSMEALSAAFDEAYRTKPRSADVAAASPARDPSRRGTSAAAASSLGAAGGAGYRHSHMVYNHHLNGCCCAPGAAAISQHPPRRHLHSSNRSPVGPKGKVGGGSLGFPDAAGITVTADATTGDLRTSSGLPPGAEPVLVEASREMDGGIHSRRLQRRSQSPGKALASASSPFAPNFSLKSSPVGDRRPSPPPEARTPLSSAQHRRGSPVPGGGGAVSPPFNGAVRNLGETSLISGGIGGGLSGSPGFPCEQQRQFAVASASESPPRSVRQGADGTEGHGDEEEFCAAAASKANRSIVSWAAMVLLQPFYFAFSSSVCNLSDDPSCRRSEASPRSRAEPRHSASASAAAKTADGEPAAAAAVGVSPARLFRDMALDDDLNGYDNYLLDEQYEDGMYLYEPETPRMGLLERRETADSDALNLPAAAAAAAPRPKLTASIAAYETHVEYGREYVVYKIRVSNHKKDWTVSRRFRNFEKLHAQLNKTPEFRRLRISLPPKRIFLHRIDVNFIRRRRLELEEYLAAILRASPEVSEHSVIFAFLRPGYAELYDSYTSEDTSTQGQRDDDSAASSFVDKQTPMRQRGMGRGLEGGRTEGTPRYDKDNSGGGGVWSSVLAPPFAFSASQVNEAQFFQSPGVGGGGGIGLPLASGFGMSITAPNPFCGFGAVSQGGGGHLRASPDRVLSGYSYYDEDANDNGSSGCDVDSDSEVLDPYGGAGTPLYELLDCIFQLNRRGSFRRQVLTLVRQALPLVVGDAIDSYVLSLLRGWTNEHSVARAMLLLHGALWPGGTWYSLAATQAAAKAAEAAGLPPPIPAPSPRVTANDFLNLAAPQPDFGVNACRVKQRLFSPLCSPAALVRLVGQEAFSALLDDLWTISQSRVFMLHIGYGLLNCVKANLFPDTAATAAGKT